MIFISHRGNLDGINSADENKPSYIQNALNRDFDVEADIWYFEKSFFLGHDKPDYLVNDDFLSLKRIWFHAKNIEALYQLNLRGIHCYFHQNDDVVLTSKGFLWTYPGKKLTSNSICVMPELSNVKNFECAGICSDFILDYYKKINNLNEQN